MEVFILYIWCEDYDAIPQPDDNIIWDEAEYLAPEMIV